jgi:phenylpropionate dioxygenase-like ring-hydroxylating dioxygenase large terminal subunit
MAWRVVASSSDVVSGGVVTVEIDGDEIVLWRSDSGAVGACDARCPHQWAHLGAVGAIDGEELVCLSHFWRFAVDGRASKVAMNGRRDDKGSIPTHPVREVDGRVEVMVATDR